jgi:hypothetical protein
MNTTMQIYDRQLQGYPIATIAEEVAKHRSIAAGKSVQAKCRFFARSRGANYARRAMHLFKL